MTINNATIAPNGSFPKPRYGFEDVANLTKNTPSTISEAEFTKVIVRKFDKDGDPVKRSNKEGISREDFVEKEFIDGNGHVLTAAEKNALFDAMEATIPNDDSTHLTDAEVQAYFSKYNGSDGVMNADEWTDALGTKPAAALEPQPNAENKIIDTIKDEVEQRQKAGNKWFSLVRLEDLLNGVDPKDAAKHPIPIKKPVTKKPEKK